MNRLIPTTGDIASLTALKPSPKPGRGRRFKKRKRSGRVRIVTTFSQQEADFLALLVPCRSVHCAKGKDQPCNGKSHVSRVHDGIMLAISVWICTEGVAEPEPAQVAT